MTAFVTEVCSIMSVQNEAVHSITALNNWFICNKLSLNFSKTCYRTFFANTAPHCNLIVNGQQIEKVNSCKYLGIIIDDELKWNLHIEIMIQKINEIYQHLL